VVGWRLLAGLGDDVLEQDGPANQGVVAVADARFHWQVEIAGFVDQAATSLAARVTSSPSSGSKAPSGSGGSRRCYLVRFAPQVEVTALLAGTKLSRTSALALTSRVPTTSRESSSSATSPEVSSMAARRA
jgi:hypothetical protein